jgi:hypothetical protein
MDAAWSGVMQTATAKLAERLEHGDEVATRDGVHTVQVKALDCARIVSLIYDRRALLRRQPTSIRADLSGLGELAMALERYREREERDVTPKGYGHREELESP